MHGFQADIVSCTPLQRRRAGKSPLRAIGQLVDHQPAANPEPHPFIGLNAKRVILRVRRRQLPRPAYTVVFVGKLRRRLHR